MFALHVHGAMMLVASRGTLRVAVCMVPRCLAPSRPFIRCCAPLRRKFFEVDGCDPQRLVPLGGALSELLEREKGGLSRSNPV